MRVLLEDSEGYFCAMFNQIPELLLNKCGPEWENFGKDMHGLELISRGEGRHYCRKTYTKLCGGSFKRYEVVRQEVYCSATPARNQWSGLNKIMSPTRRMQRRRRVAARIAPC